MMGGGGVCDCGGLGWLNSTAKIYSEQMYCNLQVASFFYPW